MTASSSNSQPIKCLGWKPDLPDERDLLFTVPAMLKRALPAKVDLTRKCPPVYSQGNLGSCTANAIGAAIEFDQMKERKVSFKPSRLFIYYNERVIWKTVNKDSGASIRDGIKSVAKQGVPPEHLWPYSIKKFKLKPSARAYANALTNLVTLYQRVRPTLPMMKGCLAAGFPFVLGINICKEFERKEVEKTGIVPMPKRTEKIDGGHAVLVVGYDDKVRQFIVRNSWGVDWGMRGYFRLPYAYLTSRRLSGDMWTIRSVEGQRPKKVGFSR